jgi:hypothetical protein
MNRLLHTELDIDHIPCNLSSGSSEIRIKLSNFDNAQWRLWTFHTTIQKT